MGKKAKPKAKKVFTTYGTYSNLVTYEYRGVRYEVEYPVCFNYCCTPPNVQHADAQRRIDAELDNPRNLDATSFDAEAVFKLMGWD